MITFSKTSFFRLFVFFIPNFITSKGDTYRILVISPFIAKSHNNMLESVAKVLAIKGHQVDVISHFELKNPPKNYKTIINLDGTVPKLINSWTMEFVENFRRSDLVSAVANDYSNNLCKLMYLEKFQKLIKNPPMDPPYDLVITEALAGSCYIGFGHILKVPVVLVSALMKLYIMDVVIGNPRSTAFASQMHTENVQIPTFWDRVKNTVYTYYNDYRYFKYTEKTQTELMRKYLSSDIPSIREIEKNVALLFVNGHHTMFGIKPNTPSVVQISGIQIEQTETQMDPDLRKWMDESIHGVILFSLGSMVIIEDFSEETLLEMYASFAKLAPMRILMKILNEDKLPRGLPNNVLTMPWIPQIPVLRHNNMRLFITHGGLNSVQEALYFGVPMIGFPLFADQMLNIKLLAAKNVAYEIDYDKMSAKTLDKALNNVLNDPKYRDAAKYESRLYLDRPMNASDTAVFWTEYVIRNGAKSLRSPAMDINWWQFELLDVYGFFLVCIFLTSYLLFITTKNITRAIASFTHSNSLNFQKNN